MRERVANSNLLSAVGIVRVTRSNARVLENVAPDVFDEPIDTSRLATYLRSREHLMVVAIFKDRVVGQVAGVVHRHPDKHTDMFVDEVGVTHDFRKRGLATAMLRRLFAIGKTMGCEEAWVLTELDNVGARKLYGSAEGRAREIVMYEYALSGTRRLRNRRRNPGKTSLDIQP
jgi:ribosomal protein S18 acetylase RimI-like enzyme